VSESRFLQRTSHLEAEMKPLGLSIVKSTSLNISVY